MESKEIDPSLDKRRRVEVRQERSLLAEACMIRDPDPRVIGALLRKGERPSIIHLSMQFINSRNDVIDAPPRRVARIVEYIHLLAAAGACLEFNCYSRSGAVVDALLQCGMSRACIRDGYNCTGSLRLDASRRLGVFRTSLDALIVELVEVELDLFLHLGVARLITDGCMWSDVSELEKEELDMAALQKKRESKRLQEDEFV
jgi:hypothetical protein